MYQEYFTQKSATVAVYPPVLKVVKIAHLGLNCREESQHCKFASKLPSNKIILLRSVSLSYIKELDDVMAK